MATERSVAVAVDLDYALAQVLAAAVEKHNAEKKTTVTVADLKTPEWTKLVGGEQKSPSQLVAALVGAQAKISAVDGASVNLKPLRKQFTLLAIADRPRTIEKQTREWLDEHFLGVFDKVLFVDVENGKDDVATRKKALFKQFKVKIAVSADPAALETVADVVDHAVNVGLVPWGKPSTNKKIQTVENWIKCKETLEKLAQDLQLPVASKVTNGPKLAKYTDDLVSVSVKKPAAFYASMVNTKFTVQKQDSVRLQASEGAISTAVQAAELVKAQKNAAVSKISTRYVSRRGRFNTPNHRTPVIEIIVTKIAA